MPEHALPPYVPLQAITERLPEIFPEGTDQRNWLTREIASKTIFVMIYIGAVEGYGQWIRPNQIARMTDEQSRLKDKASRVSWRNASLTARKAIPDCWYADNTREPIRDETIRMGLIPVGAVYERDGLPTTSSIPRYALRRDFADLFIVPKKRFIRALRDWQKAHLSRSALARLVMVQKGVGRGAVDRQLSIRLPNGMTRRMAPGPSSEISKHVIEVFASRFLEDPGVIFLSESKTKTVHTDQELAVAVGLKIDAQKVLPDIILVDLGPSTPLLVFIEVVATDGPVSQGRKGDLLKVTRNAGFRDEDVTFVTAFLDKAGHGVFRKTAPVVAWGSFVWFASEPDRLIHYDDMACQPRYLYQLCRMPDERV